MTAHRTTRQRTTHRDKPGVAALAACLVLGLVATALVAAAALAPREPAHETSARPTWARATVAGPALANTALTDPIVSPPPTPVRARASAAMPGSDTLPRPARDPPRPGTERAFYEQDLLLAARPGALDERARQLFVDGQGGEPERVAALRALWDSATPGADAWFALALRPPEDRTSQRALAVAEFALVFLHERAAREPAALDLLAQLVSDAAAPRALRRGAALSVAALADPRGLRRLATDVAADGDPDFRAALARAAARNDSAEAATLFTSGASCYGPAFGAADRSP
jgi:hypothetical protein